MTTTETYSRDELDRAIDLPFRMGFGNALAELDGDLQPPRHGRRRRCCTPCRVLDNAAAKLRDGRYAFSGPPTWETRGVCGAPWSPQHDRLAASTAVGDGAETGSWARCGVRTRASAGATTGRTWGHARPLASPSTAVVE